MVALLLRRKTGKTEQEGLHYLPSFGTYLVNNNSIKADTMIKQVDSWKTFDGERESEGRRKRLVCVTSGTSYLSLAIIERLLCQGYSVRVTVSNQEEMDSIRVMGEAQRRLSGTMVDMRDVESLCDAFRDCRGVFHTSSFTDPAGLSGYSKQMVELERIGAETVIEACARTESVRQCVLTSSLLACIWREPIHGASSALAAAPPVLDEAAWSDESYCSDKKLWLALGKTKAEKAAWLAAEANNVNLSTLCTGLVTGPTFCQRNSTASIAYLKGAQEMYAMGVMAVVDVRNAAVAHVCVFEAMDRGVQGRFICFDRAISSDEEATLLSRQMQLSEPIAAQASVPTSSYQLCNFKLSTLMSTF